MATRTYGTVPFQFWTDQIGKEVRAAGADAQRVALYLQTSPASTMYGLYYLPLVQLCDEVGISKRSALKALGALWDIGFAFYDEESQQVFVRELAAWQVTPAFVGEDNRRTGLLRELRNPHSTMRRSPFVGAFLDRYRGPYRLEEIAFEGPSKPLRRPSGAPPKPGTGSGTGSRSRTDPENGEDLTRSVPGRTRLQPERRTERDSRPSEDEDRLRQAHLMAEIISVTGDRHSGRFFAIVVSRCRDAVVWNALGQTKEAMALGQVANPGAYFTRTVKKLALEDGLDLDAQRPQHARRVA